jgi:hypothetical protein
MNLNLIFLSYKIRISNEILIWSPRIKEGIDVKSCYLELTVKLKNKGAMPWQ